tara:strand:- start:179 stop:730 length:552 start_codon:yes stop_codon:yes gene_type:complete
MSTLTVQNIQGSASSSNTISVASGHTLHQPGMIIQTQVAQFQEGIGGHTRVETTSQTPVATNILVTITPKFSTSKLLVNFSGQGAWNSAATGNAMELYLYRSVGGASFAAADLSSGKVTNYAAYSNDTTGILHSVSFSWLDNPATTSAVIYKIYIASANGAGQVKFGANTEDLKFISVMEIAQ